MKLNIMEYEEIFKTAKSIDTLPHLRESRRRFKERIEKADMSALKSQMSQYPDIKEILTTPAKELDPLYLNLIDEVFFDGNQEKCLFDMVEYPMKKEQFKYWQNYFSFTGDKITGFITYELVANTFVNEIKMFSFNLNKSLTLLRDLDSLIADLKERYQWIHWGALERNEIGNKIYRKAVEKYNGIFFKRRDSGEPHLDYFIPGTKPLLPDYILKLAKGI